MFDIYSIESESLLIARLDGILDSNTAEELIKFVEIKEVEVETGFNRFCDLTELKGIRVSSSGIQEITDRRRHFNPNRIRVKSAFLATDLLSFAVARMYEQMLKSARIQVRVWDDLQAAADWLGVKVENRPLLARRRIDSAARDKASPAGA
jgi:hypothetical protein